MTTAKSSSRRMPRWKRLSFAAGFFLLGVIGLAVPVMPQWIFFLMSMLLLGPDVPPFRRAGNAILRKWPKLRRLIPRRFRNEVKPPK